MALFFVLENKKFWPSKIFRISVTTIRKLQYINLLSFISLTNFFQKKKGSRKIPEPKIKGFQKEQNYKKQVQSTARERTDLKLQWLSAQK